MVKKSHWITLVVIILVFVLAVSACEATGGNMQTAPEGGETAPQEPAPEQPTEAPPEPEPTKEPAEPAATPVPTQAPVESGGETSAEGDLLKMLIVLVIILLIIGVIMMIVAALGGSGSSKAPPAMPVAAPLTVEDHLNTATPKAAELYKRFAELVQTFGVVSVVPTQTRIDFQVRMIFATVEFREDSLLVNLVLPQRVESPRIIRVDTYTQSSFANYLYIRTFDDYDAEFSAWLQEAYNINVRRG